MDHGMDHDHGTMDPMMAMATNDGGGHGGHGGHGGGNGGMGDMGGMHDDMMMMMQMYFYASTKCTILFKGWEVDSVGGMLGSCVGLMVLAAFYEGLKVAREILLRKATQKTNYTVTSATHGSANILVQEKVHKPTVSMVDPHHIGQSFLHMFQVFVSYLLMLAFMTYNAYVCIAIILGAGLGYFLFGWMRQTVVDVNEHCH